MQPPRFVFAFSLLSLVLLFLSTLFLAPSRARPQSTLFYLSYFARRMGRTSLLLLNAKTRGSGSKRKRAEKG